MKKAVLLLSLTGIMNNYPSVASPSCQIENGYNACEVSSSNAYSPLKPKRIIRKRTVIGTHVRVVPSTRVVVHANGISLIYAAGVFYRQLSDNEYVIVKPEIGMLVPQLPEYNVEIVHLKGEDLFLFENTLYKQVPTTHGLKYQVVGFIE